MAYDKAPWNKLWRLLENYPSTADEVESVVRIVRDQFPVLPTPKIIYPGGVWPLDKPHYVHKPHLTDEPESFQIALMNIAKTGKTLNSSEHIFLRYILDAPFMGWSGTLPNHHDDDWMQYLRHRFSPPDLVPILDDMTWPEEIAVLPPDYGVGGAMFALLANSTDFYFYEFDGDALSKAGMTLEDVYDGMQKRKWWPTIEDPWEDVKDNGEEYDHYDYFPDWIRGRKEYGEKEYKLVEPLRPFIPHSRPVVDDGDKTDAPAKG